MGQELLTSSWKCLGARAPTGASFLTCLQRCTTPSTWPRYIRCDRVNYPPGGQCVGGGPPWRVFLDTQLSEQNTETRADRRSTEAQELPFRKQWKKRREDREGGWEEEREWDKQPGGGQEGGKSVQQRYKPWLHTTVGIPADLCHCATRPSSSAAALSDLFLDTDESKCPMVNHE